MFNERDDFNFEAPEIYDDYKSMSEDPFNWLDDDSSVWSNIDSTEDSFWSDSVYSLDSDGDTKMDLKLGEDNERYDGFENMGTNIQRIGDLPVMTLTQNGMITVSQSPLPYMIPVTQEEFMAVLLNLTRQN